MRMLTGLLLAGIMAQAQVTFERIRRAEREPGNWLTYSGNYSAHRYSSLDQINVQNVKNLRPLWAYQLDALDKAETTPLVVEGVMYLTESPSNVTALDTRTGRPLWSFRRTVPKDVRVCCGQINRGVAVLGDLVFVGTVDAHLIALDAKIGSVRWDRVVADYKTGHSITVAPLALRDKVIVGIAGGEFGIRGFVDAYQAQTGKQVWRFWTVPAAGEPGSETWSGESWKKGSAATWVTWFIGAPASLDRTGMETCAPATICIRIAWLRSTRIPESSSGISSSRRTMCLTGTRPRSLCW